jgi:hypothetical protein
MERVAHRQARLMTASDVFAVRGIFHTTLENFEKELEAHNSLTTMLTYCLDTACLQHPPHSKPAQESVIQPSVPISLRTSVSTPIRSSVTSFQLNTAKCMDEEQSA